MAVKETLSKIKAFYEAHEKGIMAAGLTAISATGILGFSYPKAYAVSNVSDSLNATFLMLGSMLDGFVTLVPSIIHFVVAMIPLMIIGALVAAIVAIIAILPKYMKVPGRK